jgi:hypothetical protein
LVTPVCSTDLHTPSVIISRLVHDVRSGVLRAQMDEQRRRRRGYGASGNFWRLWGLWRSHVDFLVLYERVLGSRGVGVHWRRATGDGAGARRLGARDAGGAAALALRLALSSS